MDDTGDADPNSGTLTETMITGLGMSDGIHYEVEELNIKLGMGGDTFTIESTHGGATTLNAGGDDDVINVGSSGGLTDDIAGTLTVDGGDDYDILNVDDRARSMIDSSSSPRPSSMGSASARTV